MEYRLDSYLERQDQQAIEDGEAEARAYCWCCGEHKTSEEMCPLPDLMCKECKRNIEEVEKFTEECRADQAQREQTDIIHTGKGILAWLCQIR